ncbi:MAG: hypothetical protein A2V88_17835 [Elusimicrobia bacterium RBG_16_66_12]|nr:MAG: hypothetical protein A2V88_17835 [Elusimicrobia bacterium RBG_16_66_12]
MPGKRAVGSRGGQGGFLMMEVLLTFVVIGIAMTALNAALIMMVKSNTAGEASVVSAHLSQRMLEEIRLRRWDERTPTPAKYTSNRSNIGRDGAESSADKSGYDDIDDFDGWSESPPRDPLNNPLTAFDDYATSVTVRYVNVTTLGSTGSRTDFKAVQACSWRKKRKSICLDTLITNR